MDKSNFTPKKQQQEGAWRGSYMRNTSQLQERSALGRLLNATIVVCGACYILYVAVYLGLDLREIVAKPSQEPVKVKLYIRSKGSQWEGQPLQLHSAGHSSVPPMDASSESSYAGRDEESSNTIAEPVPGLGAGESAAEAARPGLDETSPPSAARSEGSERDFGRPGDPASGVQVTDSLQGLSMPDDDDEAPDGVEATHLGPLAADSLEDLLRSDSRDRRSSEGPHGEMLGRTAEAEEVADVLLADRTEEGIASLEAAADDGEGMQLSDSSRSGQRLGGEEAADLDSGSLEQERQDAGLHLPASEYAAGVNAEDHDVLLPAELKRAAEIDGMDDDGTPRSASDRRAELEAEELSLPLSAVADAADIWSEEDTLSLSAAAGMGDMDDEEAEDNSFVNF